jgi:polysaccharide export outer membrane protein
MRFAAILSAVAAVGVAAGLGGCGVIPTSGPAAMDIRGERAFAPDDLLYGVVKLTPATVNIMAQYEPRAIGAAFPDRRPAPEIRFGIGDIVSVSVFEAAAGGLFIPTEAGVRPGNFVTLPNQPVDTSGNITMPYAGAIPTRGKTPSEVQNTIIERIRNRAIEPQVVVALVEAHSSLISVLGEVTTPARFAANPDGERLLDAITRAGGPKGQGFETWVMLERGGKRAIAPFGALVYEPANNIWAHPGDTIYLYREPQIFLAFGASGLQGQFPFERWRISLSEAVAKAGGLLDVQADPGSVFLYRPLPRATAEALGVDCSKMTGAMIPVIFSVDFRDPGGYFLANKLQMQNSDVIFVANASSVDVTKFLNYVRTMIATVNEGAVATTNVYITRAVVRNPP